MSKEEQFLLEFCKEIIKPGAEMERKGIISKYAKELETMLEKANEHQVEVAVLS